MVVAVTVELEAGLQVSLPPSIQVLVVDRARRHRAEGRGQECWHPVVLQR